jgi:hypothetical protein
MIRICDNVRPSHIQVIALAAAFKEVCCPGGRIKGAYFSCGKGDILLGSVGISPDYS